METLKGCIEITRVAQANPKDDDKRRLEIEESEIAFVGESKRKSYTVDNAAVDCAQIVMRSGVQILVEETYDVIKQKRIECRDKLNGSMIS